MFGLELGNRTVFVTVGDGPVFVLVSEYKFDLDAVALGMGQRVNKLLGLLAVVCGLWLGRLL